MLPLPVFDYHRPRTLAEALGAPRPRSGPGPQIIAGGTDLLPNMKQGLFEPEHVVSIARLEELRGISLDAADGGGALLDRRRDEARRDRRQPPRAAPRARARGGGGRRGRAAPPRHGHAGGQHLPRHSLPLLQPDLLLAQSARLLPEEGRHRLPRRQGRRQVRRRGVQRQRAGAHRPRRRDPRSSARPASAASPRATSTRPTASRTPCSRPARSWCASPSPSSPAGAAPSRSSASAAPSISPCSPSPRASTRRPLRRIGHLIAASVVVSALGARPRQVRAAGKVGPGTSPDRLPETLAQAAFAECKPLTNLDDEAEWRREMVPVVVEKAVRRALAR